MGRSVLVLGGGLAGLATAHSLLAQRPDADVLVLEARGEVGGNVRTLHREGCTVELGPDAFMTRPGHAEALCRELGLGESLLAPDEASARVMVAHRGELLPLPEGMAMGVPRSVMQLAGTRLLSPLGKARAAMDLVLPSRHERDESVGHLVGRRFGREVKERMVEPIVSGIYGADVDELDAAVVMPMFANVHGSLIRALTRAPRSPGGTAMRAPSGGLDSVVRALAASVGADRILSGVTARSLARRGGGWSVSLDGGARLDADEIVLAVPPGAAADLFAAEVPELSDLLRGFRLRPALTAVLAFERSEVATPRASGALIPRGAPAPLDALGAVTFVDRKWPSRVSGHLSVVRATFRPAFAAQWIPRDDDSIVALALEALRMMFPLPEPRWHAVERFETGTPSPVVGHLRRAEEVRDRALALGGVSIVGAAVDGPGIAGCVRGAAQAAALIAGRFATANGVA
jgi:oxygen-dependent protoporphyrinogen oxidase